MTDTNIWNYRLRPIEPSEDSTAESAPVGSILGYDVEATDGAIGAIDHMSDAVDASYIVIDTGWWIFGKKRLLPAGIIDRIDAPSKKVFVNITKDQVKNAPDYDESDHAEQHHDSSIATEDEVVVTDRPGIARQALDQRFGTYFETPTWR